MFRSSVKGDLSTLFRKALLNTTMTSSSSISTTTTFPWSIGKSTASTTIASLPFMSVPSVNKTKKTAFSGDYQTPIAVQLANQMKTIPSLDFAKILSDQVMMMHNQQEEVHQVLDQLEVVGNGVIALSLREEYVKRKIIEIFKEKKKREEIKSTTTPNGIDKIKVVVDFSSPNMAKRMHVGHLRSTIIGDCICRVLERDGRFEVERVNHVGDFGTQFGMLLAYIETKQVDISFLKTLEPAQQLETVENYYKESKKLFDSDEQFKSLAHQKVIQLQQGNDENIQSLWKYLLECSRYEFDSIYERLDVKLEEKGESFYKTYIPSVLEMLKPIIKESKGARCIFTEDDKIDPSSSTNTEEPPLMVQKADGGFTYDTTDLATLWYRLNVSKAKWLIYVTDSGQALHFKHVFKVGEMMNWIDPVESSKDIIWQENILDIINSPKKVRIDHVGFGVVLDEEKKKFRTRSGETVKLHDLLDEAVKRAFDIIKEKNIKRCEEDESVKPLSDEQIMEAAKVVGYGAVKYADLRTHRSTNYIFSYEKMLDFRGNTAVYLLYAYARICSIIDKSGEKDLLQELQQRAAEGDLSLFSDFKNSKSEWKLSLKLIEFQDVLNLVMDKLEPHYLCEYLFDLSNDFSAFFRDCRVIQEDKKLQRSRLLLCEATAQTMKQGFDLLGLKTLNRL
ncbi:hypothetical protein FDP41_006176 [Naegleria fowleri]|uniref:arginine--tRNA ligase n=1 Tax=Naegleria fowleri TaxID=5763 RepID=A0A6A5BIL9_NAEFO|nr:uncharacterized protein FDP41_006176 [Naegleria fowleri]KAF0974702.1 hypothetical protein FDP41_006176 [Naegleria fowleri]CAG4711442.1 unnamed protein product [Naegleria fowleri]